jgi:hypothetical protein
MMSVSVWIDDFKRMQRRVASLHKQRRQAQKCEQHIRSPAIECL